MKKHLANFALVAFLISMLSVCKKDTIADEENTKSQNGVITISPSQQSREIKNIFSDLNYWSIALWTTPADDQPSDYYEKNYPFVKRIQFMTATGGNSNRDLFIDPEDRTNLKDYKFDKLIQALRNVVRQGLKPMIITGNVPAKYSLNPVISSAFEVNVKPPTDYTVYYDYIKAIADTVVKEFGLSEVSTWTWEVLTEYENKDWFVSDDGLPESTKKAYFKLYDYTVQALQDAIGAENLCVGAHSMSNSEGFWDEREFIDHVAKGVNYYTGEIGTQINFLTASFYDRRPGEPNPKRMNLEATINYLRDRAESHGLMDLHYGIDEGRILSGPPDDPRQLTTRVVGLSFQGAADAKLFKTMTDLNADWFSAWGLTTEHWGGVNSVGTHVSTLGYKMAGEKRINMEVGYKPQDKTNVVDGLASINPENNTIHVMI